MGWTKRKWKSALKDILLWSRTTKNLDVSTGQSACLLAHSLTLLTGLFAHSLTSGLVGKWINGCVFFSVLDHSAFLKSIDSWDSNTVVVHDEKLGMTIFRLQCGNKAPKLGLWILNTTRWKGFPVIATFLDAFTHLYKKVSVGLLVR